MFIEIVIRLFVVLEVVVIIVVKVLGVIEVAGVIRIVVIVGFFRGSLACKHKECARCENHTVNCAESPSYLYNRSGKGFSGYSLDIERIDG